MMSTNVHGVAKIVTHPIFKVESKSSKQGYFFTRTVEFVRANGESYEVVAFADNSPDLAMPGDTVHDVLNPSSNDNGTPTATSNYPPNVVPTPEPMPTGDVFAE